MLSEGYFSIPKMPEEIDKTCAAIYKHSQDGNNQKSLGALKLVIINPFFPRRGNYWV
jgi:hypothetical protein